MAHDAPPLTDPAGADATSGGSAGGGRQAALAFIVITIIIDMLAMGVTAPILPTLIQQMSGDKALGGIMNGVFVAVFALMQFVFSPVLGGLSDRYGRRPVLIFSIFGLGLNYIMMAMAPSLGWLLAARVLTGVTSANMSTAAAYIADVTPAERRAAAFGLMSGAFSIGFILGPALGGLAGAIDPRAPFWLAAGFCLVNGVYGWFVLPESLSRERRAPFNWRRANSIGSLHLLGSHPELLVLAIVNLLTQFASAVYPTVFVIYAAARYGWSASAMGLCLAGFGLSSGLVQWTLTGRTARWFGERGAIVIGLVFGTIGMAMFGLAATPLIFALAIPVMTLSGVAQPATQALMTRRVAPSEQGQLQGANTSLQSLAQVAAPLLFGWLYSLVQPWNWPPALGAPFLLASLFMLTAVGLAWWAFMRPGPRLANA